MGARTLLLLGILGLGPTLARSQSAEGDTTAIALKEVVILHSKLRASEIGLPRIAVDSALLTAQSGTSMAELLRLLAAGQLRSYGANGLTTASFRGTGGSHTAVLWNGINLQSPLSGQLDLSLLPTGIADEVSIQKGGAAALYGNGAIGGTIHLENQARFGEGLRLQTRQDLGSFGQHNQQYTLRWSNARWHTQTQVFGRNLANNYPYLNPYRRPVEQFTRRNASIAQQGVVHQTDWQAPPYHRVGIKLWGQQNDVQVPASILSSNDTEAIQEDDFVRGLLYWQWDHRRFSLSYKQAFQAYRLQFVDPRASIDSESLFSVWTHRLEVETNLGRDFDWVAGLNVADERSRVTAFGNDNPQRQRWALYQSVRYLPQRSRWQASATLRMETVSGTWTPLMPSVGWQYQLAEDVQLSGNYSRNYRLPTFNDLYWKGGSATGNPDLLPEDAWSAEQTIGWTINPRGNWHIDAQATGFTSWVDNWVLWQPNLDGIWTPNNVKQVWNRGVEAQVNLSWSRGEWTTAANLQYTWVQATNSQVAVGNSGRELGKQLAYTPQHEGSATLQAQWKGYRALTTLTYTSLQYTDGENSAWFALPGYFLANLSVTKDYTWKTLTLGLRAGVNNLLDASYENRRGYPMPGRNYTFGLTLTFDK